MRLILVLLCMICGFISRSQTKEKVDTIGPGIVYVRTKTIEVDSSITVVVGKPEAKIVNNFIYTSGKKRFRVKLYANGLYTKKEEK